MHRLPSLVLLCIVVGITWLPVTGQDAPGNKAVLPELQGIQPGSSATNDACLALRNQISQLNEQKKYTAVADAIKKSLSACPDRSEMLLILAKAEMLSAQFSASLNSLHLLLTENPTDVDALITQGEVQYLQGDDVDAIGSLKHAIQIAPANVESHYVLGRLYYAQSNVGEATEQFQEAVKLDAGNYKAYDGLALCYENSNKIGLAADNYMKGIALVYRDHPHYDVIYADFAELMLRYGENRKAFDLAVEAATRNPQEPRDVFLAGKALYQDGNLQDSIRWLNKAAAMNPLYADPHYILARVYRRLGKMDEARQESEVFEKLEEKTSSTKKDK